MVELVDTTALKTVAKSVKVQFFLRVLSRYGEIGRHDSLKNYCQKRTGSSPATDMEDWQSGNAATR